MEKRRAIALRIQRTRRSFRLLSPGSGEREVPGRRGQPDRRQGVRRSGSLCFRSTSARLWEPSGTGHCISLSMTRRRSGSCVNRRSFKSNACQAGGFRLARRNSARSNSRVLFHGDREPYSSSDSSSSFSLFVPASKYARRISSLDAV